MADGVLFGHHGLATQFEEALQRIEDADQEAAAQKALQEKLALPEAPMSELARKSELDVIMSSSPGLKAAPAKGRPAAAR